jgi:hypothetical protein
MWGDMVSRNPCDDDKEYAAGKYFFKGDSLILKGVWISKSCHNKDSLHVIYRCSVEDFKYVVLNLISAGYDNNYSRGIKPKVVLTRKGYT